MNDHKTNGLESAATDQALTPETERSAKEAVVSLRDCMAAITAQQAANIAFDLVRHGQQHPDFLHAHIAQHPHRRAFVAQIQKRISGGAR